MEIELPDGTVLEAPDDADIKAVVRGYQRQQRIAKLKEQNPGDYDPSSREFQEKYAPVKYENDSYGIADPSTGKPIGKLTPKEREGFWAAVDRGTIDVVNRQGKKLKNLTPEEREEYFAYGERNKVPEGSLENIRAGVGSGMIRGWKGLTNLVLPDSLTPEWASDENIREMDERDRHLPGAAKVMGGVASTLPLGGITGNALNTASRALPAASVLSRALASPATRAAVEGATQGAIFADPDEQGRGALTGAITGTALHGLGRTLGRLNRGLIKKSDEALAIEQLAGQHGDEIFIPISQGASEKTMGGRIAKTLYKEALPIVPGVKGQLNRQAETAADKLREIAVKEALPPGAKLPQNAGSRVGDAVRSLKGKFDEIYDRTIKSYAFNIPKDLDDQIINRIKADTDPKTTVNKQTLSEVTAKVRELMTKFSDGKTSIDGQNLLNVRDEISSLIKQAPRHEKSVLKSAQKWIDDHIVAELKQGGSKVNLKDLQDYLDLTPAYRAFEPLRKSAQQAIDKEGRFLFRTLARNAENSPEQKVIGQLGAKVLDKPAATGTLTGKILAGLGMAGTGIGAFMSLPATLAMLAGGNTLATKGVQKSLLGDTRLQRKLVEALRNNAKAVRRAGSVARAAAVQETVGEE